MSSGIVLAAAMLTFQAIVHPQAEQMIVQQADEEDEQNSEDNESLSPDEQMRSQTKRIRRGQGVDSLTLRLPAHGLAASPPEGREK